MEGKDLSGEFVSIVEEKKNCITSGNVRDLLPGYYEMDKLNETSIIYNLSEIEKIIEQFYLKYIQNPNGNQEEMNIISSYVENVFMFRDKEKHNSPGVYIINSRKVTIASSEDLHNLLKHYDSYMPDEEVKACLRCGVSFGSLCRKHHCRSCGAIFCYSCSNHYIPYEKIDKLLIRKKNESTNNLSFFSGSEVRVCHDCYFKHTEYETFILAILKLQLSIKCLMQMLKHSQSDIKWQHAAITSLNVFLNIPKLDIFYSTSDGKLNNYMKDEREYLLKHRKWVVQHREWFLALLRSENHNISEGRSGMLSSLGSVLFSSSILLNNNMCSNSGDYTLDYQNRTEKEYSCFELACKDGCDNGLTVVDLIFHCQLFDLSTDGLNIIGKGYDTDINGIDGKAWMLPYLPYVVYQLSMGLTFDPFLLEVSKISSKYYMQLRWLLTYYDKDILASSLLCNNHNISSEITESNFSTEYLFKQLYNNCTPESAEKVIDEMERMGKGKIYLPWGDGGKYFTLSSKDIKAFSSATKPIKINGEYTDLDTNIITSGSILFKKDNVFKDYIVNSVAKIIAKQLNMNPMLYNILPINQNMGLIEIVSNAITLTDLSQRSQYGCTISSWLLNNQKDHKDVQMKFRENLCFYTVLSYTLGIGDRHLNNVMITQDGKIFHIDFSYLFGSNPKPFAQTVVFSKDMLQAATDKHDEFIDYCVEKFLIVRDNIDEFIPLLYLIETRDKIADFFRNRLFLQYNKSIAGDKFKDCLKKSVSSAIDNLFKHTATNGTSLLSNLSSYWK